ncbi:MAG: hypothetical protein KA223_09115, partial [Candidatus Accumulibacter sp.]|nr:hypothetical protein [Accumulibacter sp.]
PAASLAMSAREKATLQRALEKATDEGDQRTVLRIGELLQPPQSYADEDPDDFDKWDAFDGPGKVLFENPRALLEMMISLGNEQGLIEMARDIVSDSEFRRMVRAAGGDRKQLARMLIDHLVEVEQRMPRGHSPGEAAKPAPRAPTAPRNRASVADDRQQGLFDD